MGAWIGGWKPPLLGDHQKSAGNTLKSSTQAEYTTSVTCGEADEFVVQG
ncbi:MAG: hypothetical protein WCH39_18765 [Schlesneria sp.]